MSGLAWTSIVRWGTQILTWGSTVIVARLLTPSDYGLVGMASLYMGLVTILSEGGIGTAAVIDRHLTRRQMAELNTASFLAGLVGLGITLLVSGWLGRFFDAPRLPPVVAFMGIGFIFNAMRAIPQASLRRALRFKAVAFLEGVGTVAAAVATLALAYFGQGYWSLVFGPLIGRMVGTVMMMAWAPSGYAVPNWRSTRDTLMLSRDILVTRISWYAYSNADFLIVGKFLGQAPLGTYTIGWSIASMPIGKITATVNSVAPSVFAAAQKNMAEMRRYLRVMTEGLALLVFPAVVGLGLVADDLVLLVLGDHWAGAVAPLRMLSFYAAFRSVAPLLPPVLNTTGHSRFAMRMAIMATFVLPFVFYFASRWGIVGVAASWLIVHPLVTLPVLIKVLRVLDMPAREYLRGLWPAFSACAVMAASVVAVRWFLSPDLALTPRLAAQVGTGVVTYGVTVLTLHGARVRSLRSALAMLRK